MKSKYILFLSAAIIISCELIAPAWANKPNAALPNLHTVGPGISRGGAPTLQGLKQLKNKGIRTIVDLRISPKLVKIEKQRAAALGMDWVNIPMGSKAPTQNQVKQFLEILAKAPGRPVFVHCQHGADRTGCMIGIYRVVVQKWDFARTWAEMRKYGFKPYLSELKNAVRYRVNQKAA